MPPLSRRAFLGTTLGGLTAAVTTPSHAVDVAPAPRPVETVTPPASPADTLFLTWQRDPTTTTTVQWIGPADAPNFVRYVTRTGTDWKPVPTTTRPFPKTDLKVHRAEIT